MRSKRKFLALCTGIGVLVSGLLVVNAYAVVDRPAIQPLPANLESIRANEALQLNGTTNILPFDQRQTSIVAMGDSEISGEGVGNYVPGTHGPTDWCDRSYYQAIFRISTPVNQRYNLACSGATPANLVFGSGISQPGELNQGDYLAIKARNTQIRTIWVMVGANGEGNIEFSPVASDCVMRAVVRSGPCWPTNTDSVSFRVAHTQDQVEWAVTSIKQTMHDAGYNDNDYRLVLMSYPSPVTPDLPDYISFPTDPLTSGCVYYEADAAFARNKIVPMFADAERRAAADTGVFYIDASRLFQGHECGAQANWANGVIIEGDPTDPNSVRQSMHPNYNGHTAFASCMSLFLNATPDTRESTCMDTNLTGTVSILPGVVDFKEFRLCCTPEASPYCLSAVTYDSRNHTGFNSAPCDGGREQGLWFDPISGSIHSEFSQARCLDAAGGGNPYVGQIVQLYNCNRGTNQQWTILTNGAWQHISPTSNPTLCIGLNQNGAVTLQWCGQSGDLAMHIVDRRWANPRGYNYNDFIGSNLT